MVIKRDRREYYADLETPEAFIGVQDKKGIYLRPQSQDT